MAPKWNIKKYKSKKEIEGKIVLMAPKWNVKKMVSKQAMN